MPKLIIDIPEEIYQEWIRYFIPNQKTILATHIIIENGELIEKGAEI